MDKFNSIFELLTAFNAAFIISQEFTTSLNTRINGVLENSKKLLYQLEGIVDESQKQITSYLNGVTGKQKDYLSKLAKQNKDLRIQVEALEKEVLDKILNSGISNTFNYYCLFAFIYSSAILLLSALEVDLSKGCGEFLFIFNIAASLGIALIVKRRGNYRLESIFPTGYLALLSAIPFGLCLLLIYYLFRKNGTECPFDFLHLNILMALTIPCAHFVGYFLKSLKNRTKLFPQINRQVEELRLECEEKAKEIRFSIKAIDETNGDDSTQEN